MILAIDVGNTDTQIGLMHGLEVRHTFRISTTPRTTDELGVLLLTLLQHRSIAASDVQGAICSSVVPSAIYTIAKACRRFLEVDLLEVGKKLKTGIRIQTDNPREVGADRIVSAVAAVERWGGPLVIVDFGTATTVDCVTERGDYIGGAIAPGFKISEEALFSRTAKLPRIEVARPPSAIGRNTVHAMQSGMFWGYVGLVDSLVRRCRAEMGGSARVVATGAMSSLIAPESETIEEVDPWLALRGLALLYTRNA